VKRTCRYLPLLSLLLFSIPYAGAQSSFDLNLGFGTAFAKAAGSGIDNTTFGPCILAGVSSSTTANPICVATPKLSGFFLGAGGAIMMTKRFGLGFEAAFQPAKSDYSVLQYRQTFYDVNGIFSPLNLKRVIVQLQGGLGGAKTSFSITQSGCVGTAVVCTTQVQPVGNSNHFQIHAGLGVQLFVTDHIFIRPQFDLHYVPNFTDQFGTNVVPAATVWLGYSFGDR
jgi:Outer membrane protein beta-barrel domain